MNNPTSIRLSEELLKLILEDATKEKRSISKQIEYIIENYYYEKKTKIISQEMPPQFMPLLCK